MAWCAEYGDPPAPRPCSLLRKPQQMGSETLPAQTGGAGYAGGGVRGGLQWSAVVCGGLWGAGPPTASLSVG